MCVAVASRSVVATGTSVPSGVRGYEKGSLFLNKSTGDVYRNGGTFESCSFVLMDSGSTAAFDTISESTAGAGVTVDGVLLKDASVQVTSDVKLSTGSRAIFNAVDGLSNDYLGSVGNGGISVVLAGGPDFLFTANTFTAVSGSSIETNTIAETTAASGVTVDGVLLKDAGIVATGTLQLGGTDKATVNGIYHSGTIAVSVPSIANDVAENVDTVTVDISALTFAAAVGDAVIANPLAALPANCALLGAFVSATDQITLSFGSIEGGAGVTGASTNFSFLIFDLT